jgi:hypothetical protein
MAGNGPAGDATPGARWRDHERPEDDWTGDEWTDDDWPDDDWPDGEPVPRWPAPPLPSAMGPGGPGRGDRPRWRSFPLLAAIVAVAAGAAGAALVILLAGGPGPSPSAATAPNGAQPVVPTQGAGGVPGGGLSGGPGIGHVQLLTGGRVTAVSSTSITLTAQGNTITAAVTSSTKVTGKVTSISGIKVGDQVLAQLTGNGSSFTATTIQDPASIP